MIDELRTTLTIYAPTAAAACQMVEDMGHSVIYVEPTCDGQSEPNPDDSSNYT